MMKLKQYLKVGRLVAENAQLRAENARLKAVVEAAQAVAAQIPRPPRMPEIIWTVAQIEVAALDSLLFALKAARYGEKG